MIWPFGKKKEAPFCPCGKLIGESNSVINYRYLDADTNDFAISSMKICQTCSDELEAQSKDKDHGKTDQAT